jgi:hypothetical protein
MNNLQRKQAITGRHQQKKGPLENDPLKLVSIGENDHTIIIANEGYFYQKNIQSSWFASSEEDKGRFIETVYRIHTAKVRVAVTAQGVASGAGAVQAVGTVLCTKRSNKGACKEKPVEEKKQR